MTREQLITRFTRHPAPDAQQDKAGTAHSAIAVAAAAFALALFESVPNRPSNEPALRDALAHIESAVDTAVDALADHAAEHVDAAPVFATHDEAGTDDAGQAGSHVVDADVAAGAKVEA